ncbi:MAG: putative Ig domain-containing protein [Bacillota bacterium]|nr:putative Ig domain-containing protein [Bacillota bacterium]
MFKAMRPLAAALMAAVLVIGSVVSAFAPTALADAGSPTITTTSLPDGQVGQPYSATLQATGGTPPYAWSVASGSLPDGLTLDSSTGAIGGTPTAAGSFTFAVQVADSAGSTAETNLAITISPAPSAPTVDADKSTVTANPTSVPADGTTASTVTVTVNDSGGNPIQGVTVTLAGNGGTSSTISPSSATTDANGQAAFQVTDSTPETVTYTATAGGVQIAQTAQVTFTSQASQPSGSLTISTKTFYGVPSNAEVGVFYTGELAVSGGVSPYTWSATGLPAGLTIIPDDATDVAFIQGMPSAAGDYAAHITVTDVDGQSASMDISIHVIPGPSIIMHHQWGTVDLLPGAEVGAPYDYRPTVTGGTPPYTWSADGLPAGLSIDPSTGEISGTLSAAGGSFSIRVVDAAGAVAFDPAAIPVYPITATVASGNSDAQVGQAYMLTLQASGGSGDYAWSADGLPDGLTLQTSNGAPDYAEISGTPTVAGDFAVTVTVSDPQADPSQPGSQATMTLSIHVAPAQAGGPQITTTTLPTAVRGQPYSAPLQATGGQPPYTWSAPSLSWGLSIDPATGEISGEVSQDAPGQITFSVSVSDTAGQTGYATLTIPVLSGLAITTTSLPAGEVGQPYSAQLEATGGQPPYTWSATSLPDGLSVDPSSGLITGTPAAAGIYQVQAAVSDTAGQQAEAAFTLVVSQTTSTNPVQQPTSLTITTTALQDATVGEPYSAQLQAAGGTPPYTWTAPYGLPFAWMQLDASGSISGTPDVAGSGTVTVQVTDSAGQTAVASLPFTVVAGAGNNSSPIITLPYLPTGKVGEPYQAALQATGGQPPYSWAVSALPDGLSLDPSTGVISGIPTVAMSNLTTTVTVTDSAGVKSSQTVTITILPADRPEPPHIAATALPDGTVGQPYAEVLASSWPSQPPADVQLRWSDCTAGVTDEWRQYLEAQGINPGLPDGLSLDPSTGAVTGVPTEAGTWEACVELDVSDPSGANGWVPADFANIEIRIHFAPVPPVPPLVVTTGYLPTGFVGQPYSAAIMAAGGQPPYTWSVGGLPNGLALSGDEITGAPTAAGDYAVTLTVTDSAGATASQVVELRVIEQPQPAPAPTPAPAPQPQQPQQQTGEIKSEDGGVTVTAPGQSGEVKSVPVQAGTPVGDGLEAASNVYVFAGALIDADITFVYDPEVFYPMLPTGMLADRLGIYAYYGGQWHYVGGKVDTQAHTVSIAGLNLTDFPQGTQFAVLAMTTRFHDLPDAAHAAWFTRPVDAAVGHHVLYGYPDGTFRPGAPVTRAEFAAMLARALHLDAPDAAKQTFSDVAPSSWEFGAVEAAAQAGLVNGYPDGSFKPDRPITREELAAMVARALDYARSHKGLWTKAMKAPDLTPPAWADADKVSVWARDAVTAAAKAGIVNGYPDGSFKPHANATRAETAAMMARLIADLGI